MEKLIKITEEIYGKVPEKLIKLYRDVESLYNGKCPLYEKCEVGYHTFNHAKEVALATAYMIAGWNKVNKEKIDENLYLIAIAASLFHDSGYIKDKGDKKGKGGKFTFIHEPRSAKIAKDYLKKNNYPENFQKLVSDIILLTDFKEKPKIPEYFSEKEKAIASMVATADLIAQMADVSYLKSLNNLYEEMKEAYEFEGYENLKAKGIKIYTSAAELKENLWEFFENSVIPRLVKLGSVYKYFKEYFPAGRNPYGESILANLTYHNPEKIKFQKIEKLLTEMGTICKEEISKLKYNRNSQCYSNENIISIIDWIEETSGKDSISNVLLNLGAVGHKDLRNIYEKQLLPDEIINKITINDWPKILLISMLLGKIRFLPLIFTQVLEIINELLDCECSSILLADKTKNILKFIVATGPNSRELKGLEIPADKGVAGWVYTNKKFTIINEVNYDARFNDFVDKSFGFRTKSLLAVPLFFNEEIIGVIEAVNKKNKIFDSRDMAILTIFSHQFSFCLDTILWAQENIKNYEKKA